MLRYVVKDEGELSIFKDVLLKDLNLNESHNRIQFMQDDATKLKERYTDYDVIVAINLIEEIRQPKEFLNKIHLRLNADGLLILGSTYEYKESVSQMDNWIGGFKKDGEPIRSIDGISQVLSEHFTQESSPFNLTYPVRKSSRHFEVISSEVSIWRKKI